MAARLSAAAIVAALTACAAAQIVGDRKTGWKDAPPMAPLPPAPKPAPPPPQFTPGREVRVELPQRNSFFLVYVPADYTPDRAWPVIVNYPDENLRIGTAPFSQLTDGKGWIVVGMNFAAWTYPRAVSSHMSPSALEERRYLSDVFEVLEKNLKMDASRIYIAGAGAGGYAASHIGEELLPKFAGLIILNAGRSGRDRRMAPAGIRNKPMFIGVGAENAQALAETRLAVNFYRGAGADVTYEEWNNVSSGVPAGQTKLGEWLNRRGPGREVSVGFEAAAAAEKKGRFGEAYAAYEKLAANVTSPEQAARATAAARALAAKAEKLLADAQAATDARDFSRAAKAYGEIAAGYKGTRFGDQAAELYKTLTSDPLVRAAIEKADVEGKASALEAQAAAEDRQQNYGQALRLYEQYLAQYPKASKAQQVTERIAAMKGDPRIMRAMAEKDCTQWLTMARSYIGARAPEKAKEYCNKVLQQYPETTYAEEAKALLQRIEEDF